MSKYDILSWTQARRNVAQSALVVGVHGGADAWVEQPAWL